MTLLQRMSHLNAISAKCPKLIGNDATAFLLETVGMQSMVDEMRHAWLDKHKTLPPAVAESAEDNFLQYLTKAQVLCLRRIYDQHMVVNENRRAAMPFVLMAFAGMDYAVAEEAVKGLASDFFVQQLLHDEVPKENKS